MALSHLDVMTIVTVVAVMTLQCLWSAYSGCWYLLKPCCTIRATKTIGGAQGKYEKWGPQYRMCKRVWGHAPQEIYML